MRRAQCGGLIVRYRGVVEDHKEQGHFRTSTKANPFDLFIGRLLRSTTVSTDMQEL